MKFFIDQDDVLSGFTEAMAVLGINNRTNFIHKPRETWTEEEKELDRIVSNEMMKPGFWRSLPIKKGGFELYDFLAEKQPYILTARPRGEKYDPIADRIKTEKLEWVLENFGEAQMNRTIICQRHEKPAWARDYHYGYSWSNVLIDDMEQNCREWEEAGGIAIKHEGR